SDAMDALRTYHWPRNIRELRNVIERMHTLSRHRLVRSGEVVRALHDNPVLSRTLEIDQQKRDELMAALELGDWDTAKAAQVLHVARSTVYRRMHRFGVGWRRK